MRVLLGHLIENTQAQVLYLKHIPWNIDKVLLCFVLLWIHDITPSLTLLPLFFSYVSLALWQADFRLNVNRVTRKDIGKIDPINTEQNTININCVYYLWTA